MEGQRRSSRLILVAIDESTQSFNALQWAVNNLVTSQDRIILIHAERPPVTSLAGGNQLGFMVPPEVYHTLKNDIRKSTENIFSKAMELCKAKNVTPVTRAHVGDARQVICNTANTYKPDMLVLGSHGYGAFKRVVLGSVSDYCVQHVQCPVVVVKPQENEAR